jgi:hypothetical protein
LASWLQRELALDAGPAMVKDQAKRQLLAFARASQDVAMTATLLDVLPAPSTNGVGEVYQRVKSIIGATASSRGLYSAAVTPFVTKTIIKSLKL